MNKELLELFKIYLERQDILNKLTENQKLNEYGYSEIHTISAIKELEEPNVTAIASRLKMTRSAISKITKKLTHKQLVETYEISNNKQKVFFKLTLEGEALYCEHEKRHQSWEQRDLEFFNTFSSEKLHAILLFMNSYNEYLDAKINVLEEQSYE